MAIIEHGTISNGGIALDNPLPLPEGSKVIVRIEEAPMEPSPGGADRAFQDAFPFIGQWADRTDIPDSAEYVRQERAKWQQRPYRPD